MDIFNGIVGTKAATMLLMFAICFAFIFFLRFLYGPKGIFRKNLWKNIDDENGSDTKNNV